MTQRTIKLSIFEKKKAKLFLKDIKKKSSPRRQKKYVKFLLFKRRAVEVLKVGTRDQRVFVLFSNKPLSANPTKWSNTLNLSPKPDRLFECV